jgi:hypothetical protein
MLPQYALIALSDLIPLSHLGHRLFSIWSTAASSKCQSCRSTLHLPDFLAKNSIRYLFTSTSYLLHLLETHLLLGKTPIHSIFITSLKPVLLFDIHLELAHPDTRQSSKINPHTGKVMALLCFSRPFWQGSFRGELGRARLGNACGRHLGYGCGWFRLVEIKRFGKSSTPKVSLIFIHLKVLSILSDKCSTC